MFFIAKLSPKYIISFIRSRLAQRNSGSYIAFLRGKGVKIGKGTVIFSPRTQTIDINVPSLLEIGENVIIGSYCTLLCHDVVTKVFRLPYGDLLPSRGRVRIGNNVFLGRHCSVLKGVTIGDNCIIGYGSIVTKDIPSNSIAVGSPARVIGSFEDYYKKRKGKSLNEAFEHMRCIKERFGRNPKVEDCKEEFVFFVSGSEVDNYPMLPIKYQLGPGYEKYRKEHIAPYKSFDEFIKAAGL